MPGRRTRGEDAEHEPATFGKPARRHDRAHHQRGEAGAQADHDPPEQDEMPDLGHFQRQQQADPNESHRAQNRAAQAVAIDQRCREGRHQSVEQDAHRHRAGNLFGGPAEFAVQRQNQRSGQAHRAGGHEGGHKGDRNHHPTVMKPKTRETQRQSLGQHAQSFLANCGARRNPSGAAASLGNDSLRRRCQPARAAAVRRRPCGGARALLRRARSRPPACRNRARCDGWRGGS